MSAPRTSLLRPDPTDHHASSRPESPSLPGEGDGFDFYGNPKPTFATFSPVTALSGGSTTSAAAKRSTILVHQKSPLLMATPPQITRALAYSHPFLLPLNKLAGLISWTTGDPWESFILVLVWWGLVLYGDTVIRLAGPIVLVLLLIAGMYGRRYSPLSSSGWISEEGYTGSSNKDTGGGGIGYFLFGIGAGSAAPVNAKINRDVAAVKNKMHSKSQSVDATATNAVQSAKTTNGHGATGANGHPRPAPEVVVPVTRRQKTLDEIVDTLREFTARCNILLEPLLDLTDFLSTQSTPTSATTRPALTALLVRILLCTPFWYALTLPPLRIVTTRRVAVLVGTLILTWHSRPMRVTRTILWRSATVRRTAVLVTGLKIEGPMKPSKNPPASNPATTADLGNTPATAAAALQSKLSSTKQGRRLSTPRESELTKAIRRARAGHDAGVRFTFILYENQRRWVGLGWTTSLFTYERPAWTDEHNNEVPSKDEFELPEVEDGSRMRWRWVEGSRWHVEGVLDDAVRVEKTGHHGEHITTWDYEGDGGRMGWVYYDNKWQSGRRGQDGWNRWTRRRKWFRDAELVEVDEDFTSNSDDRANTPTPTSSNPPSLQHRPGSPTPSHTGTAASVSTEGHPGAAEKGVFDLDGDGDAASIASSKSAKGLQPTSLRRRVTDANSSRGSAAPTVTTTATATAIPTSSLRDSAAAAAEEDEAALSSSAGVKLHQSRNENWGVGDEALMGLE